MEKLVRILLKHWVSARPDLSLENILNCNYTIATDGSKAILELLGIRCLNDSTVTGLDHNNLIS